MSRLPWYVAWPLVLGLIYDALCYFASRSVYYPMKYPQGLWDMQSEVGARDVWLTAADGVRLNAWWVERPGARWVTLFLHGNAGNVTHRLAVLREVPAAGSSILVLDYRGYGKSAGRPTEAGLYADAEAGYEYLRKQGYQDAQMIVHGESLGTVAAVELASRHRCAALVLEAPFPSAKAVAATVIPVLGPLLIRGYDAQSRIQSVHAPKLFIQGDRDEVIPLELGKRLYAAAPEPKTFWVVHGAGHNDLHDAAGAGYRERLQEFYGSLSAH